MIVIDNFITDRAVLDEIDTSGEFHIPKQWGWWDGWWKTPVSCHRERVIQYIWGEHCPLTAAARFPNSVAGFEHWTLAYEAYPTRSCSNAIQRGGASSTSKDRDRLPPHQDRDELLFTRTGELKHPRVAAVYYPIDHQIEGGYLKIFSHVTGGGPFELIEPRYNRLVIFDASVLHEVLPVTAGRRYALAINVWDYRIEHPDFEQASTSRPDLESEVAES